MKIAIFSPLPPKRTGIALYTKNLTQILHEYDLDLFDTEHQSSHFMNIKVHDYYSNPSILAQLNNYDLVIYQIGNNPHYHKSIYQTLLMKNGVVIIHDAILYYLIAGQDKYSFIKDFCINYGFNRLSEMKEITENSIDNNILTYAYPERYPLLKTIIDNAQAILVHSLTAKNIILEYGYTKQIYVIPFLLPENFLEHNFYTTQKKQQWREILSIRENDIIIGSYGFGDLRKKLDSTFSALQKISNLIEFKFLIVGCVGNQDIEEKIKKYNLQNHVIYTGYLSNDTDFFELLNLSDIVINLRYPSMGETSSIVIQAMSLRKACIVTNHAWFAELPDTVFYKIPYDDTEVDCLTEALLLLSQNKSSRDTLGENAQRYILQNCHPDQVARILKNTLAEILASAEDVENLP